MEPSISNSLSTPETTENAENTNSYELLPIVTITQIEDTYFYTGNDSDIDQIAGILYEQLLMDMMSEDSAREFIITEYESVDLTVISASQDSPERVYSGALDENTWYVFAEARVKYIGEISPIGFSDGDELYSIGLGDRYIRYDNGTYCLLHMAVFDSE